MNLKRQKTVVAGCLFCMAATGALGQDFRKTGNGIQANVCDMVVDIRFYSPQIVRVLKYPKGGAIAKESYSVVKEPERVSYQLSESPQRIMLSTSSLEVALDLATGKVSYADSSHKPLLTEKDYGTQFTPVSYGDTQTYLVRQAFRLDKDEALYGLGQLQEGRLNQRNQAVQLRNVNSKICIPYVYSPKGYGLLWDNYSPTTFTDNPMETAFDSQSGLCADYYFIYGDNADGVLKNMRELTGQVPMNALWTYGFWQSRERYKSQDELLGVVKKYRELGIPLDGIVQDWQYWGTDQKDWNGVKFNNPLFPDPKAMIDEVHKLNAHLMVSVWPSFGSNTDIHKELKEKKLLLDFKTFPEPAKVYDAFNEEARELYWRYMNDNLFSLGVDAWWLDATEPEIFDDDKKLNQQTAAGQYRSVFNAFPIVTVGSVFEHQRATGADKRVFILTRSASAGSQRYASSWSGDIISRWDVLAKQIPAGLNFSICGIPYWNADIGGFHAYTYPDGIKDPAFRELYVRWNQFATFTPMMRSHGTNTPREVYLMGDEDSWEFTTLKRYINLRYLLMPYLYATAWNITQNGDTYMRPLFMDFPDDRRVRDLGSEYLFGRSLLVAPVTESMYVDGNRQVNLEDVKSKEVYLPAGTDWYDFWTGEKLAGGQTIRRAAPIDIIPLYVRAGSILPIGPRVQYAEEKPWDDLEIRIYQGADGHFVLYEDENDNYNYEKGICSTIRFTWSDKDKTLTIADREGQFPGMLKKRTFRLVLVREGVGVGDEAPRQVSKTVTYKGKRLQVQL